MKKIVLALGLAGFTSVWAQTASNFSGLAITPPTSTILSPTQPALTPASPSTVTSTTTPVTTPGSVTTPAVAGSTTVSSGSTGTSTNAAGTNLSANDLSTLLLNVETALAQALPALAAFNDSFDFINLGTGSLSSVVTNSATNLTASFGENFATNSGTNFVIPTTGFTGTTPSTTNILVVPGFGSFPITRDTLRGLLVLQNDIHRLLPLVDALNGGTNFSGTNGTVPGFGLGIINSNLAATNNLPTR